MAGIRSVLIVGGCLIQLAEKHGISVPLNRTLNRMLYAIEVFNGDRAWAGNPCKKLNAAICPVSILTALFLFGRNYRRYCFCYY
jgi:hypothetical protein